MKSANSSYLQNQDFLNFKRLNIDVISKTRIKNISLSVTIPTKSKTLKDKKNKPFLLNKRQQDCYVFLAQ